MKKLKVIRESIVNQSRVVIAQEIKTLDIRMKNRVQEADRRLKQHSTVMMLMSKWTSRDCDRWT